MLYVIKLPATEPVMKLMPIIKLIGRFIVSPINKLTFFLYELFWIPTININNNAEFKVAIKKIFFKSTNIYIKQIILILVQIINYTFC